MSWDSFYTKTFLLDAEIYNKLTSLTFDQNNEFSLLASSECKLLNETLNFNGEQKNLNFSQLSQSELEAVFQISRAENASLYSLLNRVNEERKFLREQNYGLLKKIFEIEENKSNSPDKALQQFRVRSAFLLKELQSKFLELEREKNQKLLSALKEKDEIIANLQSELEKMEKSYSALKVMFKDSLLQNTNSVKMSADWNSNEESDKQFKQEVKTLLFRESVGSTAESSTPRRAPNSATLKSTTLSTEDSQGEVELNIKEKLLKRINELKQHREAKKDDRNDLIFSKKDDCSLSTAENLLHGTKTAAELIETISDNGKSNSKSEENGRDVVLTTHPDYCESEYMVLQDSRVSLTRHSEPQLSFNGLSPPEKTKGESAAKKRISRPKGLSTTMKSNSGVGKYFLSAKAQEEKKTTNLSNKVQSPKSLKEQTPKGTKNLNESLLKKSMMQDADLPLNNSSSFYLSSKYHHKKPSSKIKLESRTLADDYSLTNDSFGFAARHEYFQGNDTHDGKAKYLRKKPEEKKATTPKGSISSGLRNLAGSKLAAKNEPKTAKSTKQQQIQAENKLPMNDKAGDVSKDSNIVATVEQSQVDAVTQSKLDEEPIPAQKFLETDRKNTSSKEDLPDQIKNNSDPSHLVKGSALKDEQNKTTNEKWDKLKALLREAC